MAKMQPGDPAYWMLERGIRDPSKQSASDVYRAGCYICEDDEYRLMGLPLCKPCVACGGHVRADDCECDDCGADQRPPLNEKETA